MAFHFLAAFFFSVGAWAQTGTTGISTSTTVSGISNYFHLMTAQSANEYTAYVGKTATGCTSNSVSAACDSCATLASSTIKTIGNANPLNLVCNKSEIHPDLYFSLTLSSTNANAYANCPGKAIIMRPSGVTSNFVTPVASTQTGYQTGVAGQAVTVSFKWADICNSVGAGSTCTESFAKTFEFGFNSNCQDSAFVDVGLRLNVKFRYVAASLGYMTFPCDGVSLLPATYEGICSFYASRGDEKVYFKGIGAPESTSTTLLVPSTNGTTGNATDASGISYDKLRVFCKPVNGPFDTLTTNDVCADIQIDGKTLTKAKIEGLANDVAYEFLAANVDQAGNVTYFSNPNSVGTLGIATPAKVNGLLDGKGCFIATAAFGSSMAPEVERFRNFRDQVLLKHSWGQQFVEFYYEHSPEAARFIANNEILRIITLFLLYPILFFAEIVMRFGFLLPILALFLLVGFFRAQKRMRREKI